MSIGTGEGRPPRHWTVCFYCRQRGRVEANVIAHDMEDAAQQAGASTLTVLAIAPGPVVEREKTA